MLTQNEIIDKLLELSQVDHNVVVMSTSGSKDGTCGGPGVQIGCQGLLNYEESDNTYGIHSTCDGCDATLAHAQFQAVDVLDIVKGEHMTIIYIKIPDT